MFFNIYRLLLISLFPPPKEGEQTFSFKIHGSLAAYDVLISVFNTSYLWTLYHFLLVIFRTLHLVFNYVVEFDLSKLHTSSHIIKGIQYISIFFNLLLFHVLLLSIFRTSKERKVACKSFLWFFFFPTCCSVFHLAGTDLPSFQVCGNFFYVEIKEFL